MSRNSAQGNFVQNLVHMSEKVDQQNRPAFFIQENLDMKSILNNSRILILCVINIAVIFWIVWYHGQIQYEPLLDYANLEEKIFPLHKKVYNAIIVTIIVNILVMVLELKKLRNRKIIKSDLIIGFTYFFQIMLCMMWGYLYISSRSHNGIIDEYNTLLG